MSDASLTKSIWTALDELVASGDGWSDLIDAVESLSKSIPPPSADEHSPSPNGQIVADLRDAMHYMIATDDGRVTFTPRYVFATGGTDPVVVTSQPATVLSSWREGFAQLNLPMWRARLGHLLLEAGDVPSGRELRRHVEDVVEAYLRTAGEVNEGLDKVEAIRAAAGLARGYGLKERRHQALSEMRDVGLQEAQAQEPVPGVLLRCTAFLVAQGDVPVDVTSAVLDKAREIWQHDIHYLDEVIEQQIKLHKKDATRRAELAAERVNSWLSAAAATEGLRRSFFLQNAIKLAGDSGDADLRALATARLQKMQAEDLQMRGISTTVLMREDQVAKHVRPVFETTDWRESLDRLARFGPPTGRAAAHQAAARARLRTSVSMIFPAVLIGGDGLPRWTANTDEERLEYEAARNATFQLQFDGQQIAEALLRIPRRHGVPTEVELALHLSEGPALDLPAAAQLGRSLLRFWTGDYEGALFTAAPQVEKLAREILLNLDQAVYRLQRDRTPGQYMGLGALLSLLHDQSVLDDDWHSYLNLVLSAPVGWNLRNELAHGFLDGGGLVHAALVLHCCLHLARPFTVSVPEKDEPEPGDAQSPAEG